MTALLGIDKPVIGMVHLPALPGSPFARPFDRDDIIKAALRDRDILLDAGFDAISISNEGDRPYVSHTPPETLALFTWVGAHLTRDLSVPYGCGVLIDPLATIAVGHALGADFVRISYGVTAGSFGLVADNPGDILRYRRAIGADSLQLFVNLSPHFATSLDSRPLAEMARTYHALTQPDAFQVPGAGAGVLPDLNEVRQVKAALPDTPVLVASGVTQATAAEALAASDGIIVGTCLKVDGHIYNPVDPARAHAFMDAVRAFRNP